MEADAAAAKAKAMEEAKAKAKAKAEADAAALLTAQGKTAPEAFTEKDYPPFSFQKENNESQPLIKPEASPRKQTQSLVAGPAGDYDNDVYSLGSRSSMDSGRPRLFPPYVTPTQNKESCTSALTKCAPWSSRPAALRPRQAGFHIVAIFPSQRVS